MEIDYRRGCYVTADAIDPAQLKKLGWVQVGSTWRTAHISQVIPLHEFCIGEAAKRVHPVVAERRAKIAASNAATADIIVPVGERARRKGYDFYGYQKAAIKYHTEKHKSLNGDPPRFGKMITGLGVVNYADVVKPVERVLIICPANAKITWCERWAEWTTTPLDIDYCEGDTNPDTPALVCNWEIMDRHFSYFMNTPWDIVIADELHRCGGETSGRTKMTFGPDLTGGLPALRHWVGLSGTPIGTRPLNFWPICRFMDPLGLGANKWEFRKRYCGANAENNWDSKGATNEEELQYKARAAFMVRRDVDDVGAEMLPNRQTIRLPGTGLKRLIERERNALQELLHQYELDLDAGNSGPSAAELAENDAPDVSMMAVQDLALAALPMMIDFINEQLETEPKVVVFCNHRAVAKKLQEAFPGCAFKIGGVSLAKGEAERKRFQEDPACRVFVGNIAACAENFELSAADVHVFCEIIWQTSLLDQAEMRTWLPTKTRPIQIFRLVVDGSASADMADEMERRQQSITRATVAKKLDRVVV